MGQWFKLVNLDKRQAMELCKLSDSLYDIFIHFYLAGHSPRLLSADEFIDARQKWLDDFARYGASGLPRHRGRRDQAQSALLRKLPVELVAMCVAAAETVLDQACFALTCQAVWDIARPGLLRSMQAGASWEGDRIMVLGENVTVDDMPPGVLNDEERAVVRAMLESSNEDDGPPLVGELLDALGTTDTRSDGTVVKQWLESKLKHRAHTRPLHLRRHWDYDYRDDVIWGELVNEVGRGVQTRGAVLRNLTTHEYLRGDALQPDVGTPLHAWSFADILLMRICWSPTSFPELGGAHNPRNVWAGHRFDFAREDALPRGGDGSVLPPWKDVSDEYMKELTEWSANYGA